LNCIANQNIFNLLSPLRNLCQALLCALHSQVDAAVSSVTAHADIAAKYGKPLITYEAGSSIDGTSTFAAQVRH
jgi:hypothetical protein